MYMTVIKGIYIYLHITLIKDGDNKFSGFWKWQQFLSDSHPNDLFLFLGELHEHSIYIYILIL